MQKSTLMIIYRRSILFLLMTAFVIYTGCAAFKQGPAIQPQETNFEIIKHILHKNYLNLQTLQGSGQISIISPLQKFTGAISTHLQKPDSLHIKLEAAFGLDVGVLFADKQEFTLYSPMEQMCYVGSSKDTLNLARFIGFNMTFSQLMQAVSGIVYIDGLQDVSLHGEENSMLISGWMGNSTYRYTIDTDLGVITQIQMIDIWDQVVLQQEFQRFQKIGKVVLPQLIRYSQPLRKETLTIFYDNVQINRKLNAKDFYIKLPSDVFKFEL